MTRAPDWDVTGKDVPRAIFPSGRVRFSLGTTAKRALHRRRERLDELRAAQEWGIIKAVKDGLISVAEVERRMRQGGDAAVAELRRDSTARRTAGVPTVREEADRYLDWYARRRGPQSVKQTRSRLKRITEQVIGGTEIGSIAVDALGTPALEAAIEAVSRAPRTVAGLIAAASGCYRWSIATEAERARTKGDAPRWTVNPAQGIEVPDRDPRGRRKGTASDDQVRLLLAGAQLYQLAYLRAFLHAGLRLTELTHSRLHLDLDPTRWGWTIQARGPDRRCGCEQCRSEGWSPKTARGNRAFDVPESPPEFREAIEAYLEANPCEPGDFVFRNPRTGGKWDDHAIQGDFRRLCESVDVRYGRGEGLTLHTLRHTCITNLVRAGVRESIIAALVGDTVQTIVENYVHLEKSDLAAAIQKGPSYV